MPPRSPCRGVESGILLRGILGELLAGRLASGARASGLLDVSQFEVLHTSVVASTPPPILIR